MNNLTIFLIIFVILCIFNKIFYNTVLHDINPIGSHKVWLYSESIIKQPYIVELMIKKLKMELNGLMNDIIILNPTNIDKFVSDLPISMLDDSIPYEKRINLLHSFLLDKYGGLCISPGTIPIDINDILTQVYLNDLVTVGSNPRYVQVVNNSDYPNTNIIGSKKNLELIHEYKNELIKNIHNNNVEAYDILSKLIQKHKQKQYHFSSLSDGTIDRFKKITKLDDYLNVNGPEIKIDDLKVISLPYRELFKNRKYIWFLRLNKKQFEESKFYIQNFL